MLKTNLNCPPPETCKEKSWEYEQYYLGDKDKENRRCGEGQNHWSGAKSLEWYTGHFIRDTMHGLGDYHWRHRGPENASVTYEGHFYCNRMHGYGTMSYPDGRTFRGLFFNNVRCGPGVQSHTSVHEDVGLWRGCQLIRLAWKPPGNSIVPEFMSTSIGRAIVESHRIILSTEVKTIGETNKALELLKQCGADPRVAVEKWSKLYPKYCTDLGSPLCPIELFDQDYYRGKMYTLKEMDGLQKHDVQIDEDSLNKICTYFAWNNNNMTINMMKHSYKHDTQRKRMGVDLKAILSGPRKQFKPAGNHEIDCRTLLMAAYLGHARDVARLVNEKNVRPNISDVQGNSAVMYATCGHQPDVIHFLVEAGAFIDSFNDCCCTSLGIALMRYVCIKNDISQSGMLQALLPPSFVPAPSTVESMVKEWNITRDQQSQIGAILKKSPSKTNRNLSSRRIKSLISIKDQTTSKKKIEPTQPKVFEPNYDSDDSISENKTLYSNINHEFSIKITDTFTFSNDRIAVPYIFDVIDMIKEIEACEDEQKKSQDKGMKKTVSKTIKDAIKTSKEILGQNNEKEEISITSVEKNKTDMLTKIECTILQLLSDGANPKLVRCPQPALLVAVMCNSPNLIRHLVHCGADINEKCQQTYNYSPLDVAVSRSLTHNNLEIVRVLLECGADAKHRLVFEEDIRSESALGPTLLHAALAKKVENEIEENIHHQLLELLLKHDCSPMTFYKGRAAIDVAMGKSIDILNIFVKNSKTNLNAIINDCNQSILVKMFSISFFKSITSSERLQQFTNLLLFGADPLVKCQYCGDAYENIFVYARKTLNDLESSHSKSVSPPGKYDPKAAKKIEKTKKEEKLSTKSLGKMAVDDVEDYRQAVELVTDCARLIYIRWLQAKLMKELIVTIDKYKHRHWNVILKECDDKRTRLWLNPQRCLEIWDILSDTKKKIYKDQRIIRHLLCIVMFMCWQNVGRILPGATLTTSVKDAIEADISDILRQYKIDKRMTSEMHPLKLCYVKPELDKDVKKFDVCFECILPLNEEKILCDWCEQISFCSYDCIKTNIIRTNCHPCSEYLKIKYFPRSDETI